MLGKILSKNECAACKFCCSFRRQSLWETPLFTKETKDEILKLFPEVEFEKLGNESFTINLKNKYQTENPEEEVPCPFLDSSKGCVLPEELKPFDCKIWPIRIMKVDSKNRITMMKTCPNINKVPLEKVKEVLNEGLNKKIWSYCKETPDCVKDYRDSQILE